jgi:calcineurin-like phosphoesterase family protein
MRQFFSADFHLGHTNIIKYCNRPFSSTEEMDKTIIENINKKVSPKDILYVIGDFAWWGCTAKQLQDYRASINCKNIYLIIGNHDLPILDKLQSLFVKTEHMLEIQVQIPENSKQRIVMCHYAMRVWNQSHRRSWCLGGHSHHTLPDDPKSLWIDVGVDGKDYNFSPLDLDDIREIMSKKQWVDPFEKWEKEGKLYRTDSRTRAEHE